MKTAAPRNRSTLAFTLIELLTVIAIIAVLMGLLFPAVSSVKEAARKTQAKNDATNLVNAVKAYYTEYGKYPLANQQEEKDLSDTSLVDVLNALIANDDTLNPRKIVFIEIPKAKGTGAAQKNGLDDTGVWKDPWGNSYHAGIDGDYDNKIASPYGDTISTGIIAWSVGKDAKVGTASAPGDDVSTWQ